MKKKKGLLTLLGSICLILALVTSTLMVACAPAPAPAPEPIVLKAVQSGSIGHPLFVGWEWYVSTVNKRAEGQLIIDVLGGPEVIPLADQGDAVKDGIVDMGALYASWIGKLVVPMDLYYLRRIPPDEMRKRGAYDLLQQEFNRVGLYFLGPQREILDSAQWITLDKRVDKPQDLAGMRIATFAALAPWIEALGMTPMIMPPGERYSAIERGIVNGAAHSIEGQYAAGYYELIDYWIDHGGQSTGEAMAVNLDMWNSLPEHLQKLLTDVMLDLEEISEALGLKVQADMKQGMREGGMTPITFSPADAKWYTDLAYEACWEEAFKKHPEWAPQVYELWANP